MIKIRRASAIAAGAVAALAIGGGTAALAAGADDPAPSRSSDDRVTPPARATGVKPSSGLSIGADRAKAIAMKVAGGGRVVKVEGEVEHGQAVWDVYVLVNGVTHDIDVDRSSGSVTRHQVKGAVRGGGTDDGVNHDRNDDKGGSRKAARHEAGDDKGGAHKTVRHEAGDDKGGSRKAVRHEAGDDKGGNRKSGTDDGAKHDAGDDKGGKTGNSGKGGDDKGGDDHGSAGHGSDD
jgi:uncharacterized membrane protein YkoI